MDQEFPVISDQEIDRIVQEAISAHPAGEQPDERCGNEASFRLAMLVFERTRAPDMPAERQELFKNIASAKSKLRRFLLYEEISLFVMKDPIASMAVGVLQTAISSVEYCLNHYTELNFSEPDFDESLVKSLGVFKEVHEECTDSLKRFGQAEIIGVIFSALNFVFSLMVGGLMSDDEHGRFIILHEDASGRLVKCLRQITLANKTKNAN